MQIPTMKQDHSTGAPVKRSFMMIAAALMALFLLLVVVYAFVTQQSIVPSGAPFLFIGYNRGWMDDNSGKPNKRLIILFLILLAAIAAYLYWGLQPAPANLPTPVP